MSRKLLVVLLVILTLGFLTQVITVAQVPTMPPASDSTSCIQDSSSAIPADPPLSCYWRCYYVGGQLICYLVCPDYSIHWEPTYEIIERIGPPIGGP